MHDGICLTNIQKITFLGILCTFALDSWNAKEGFKPMKLIPSPGQKANYTCFHRRNYLYK